MRVIHADTKSGDQGGNLLIDETVNHHVMYKKSFNVTSVESEFRVYHERTRFCLSSMLYHLYALEITGV